MTEPIPQLWVCLDLCPHAGVEMPDVETIAELIRHPATAGAGWIRNWQVFGDEDAAKAYADTNPTLVFLPLALDRDARVSFG